MKKCQIFLRRPFGGKPCKSYAISYSDVKEFFVKIYFHENVWEDRLKEEKPFDADLDILSVSTFMNGALVDFKSEEWLLGAMAKRYEVDNIEIEEIKHLRTNVNGVWKFVKE